MLVNVITTHGQKLPNIQTTSLQAPKQPTLIDLALFLQNLPNSIKVLKISKGHLFDEDKEFSGRPIDNSAKNERIVVSKELFSFFVTISREMFALKNLK